MEKLYQQYWIDLPKEVREHLVKTFSINKSGITEIRDQTVVSDGHTNEDLTAVTAEKMSAYTGSPLDVGFMRLWELTKAKVHYELHPPTMQIGTDGFVSEIVATPQEAPYCTTCVSTQGRHRKGCPKYK